jgi:hypothetical protein
MRHIRMLLAVVVGVLLMTACGSLDADTVNPGGEVAAARVADEVFDDTHLDFEAMATPSFWIDYGLAEYGETWVCWAIAEEPSETDFMLNYTPPGYTWRLGVVDLGDAIHLFKDPVMGDVFETGGYEQVIACKRFDEPEEPFEEWCSPGFWRNSPIAAGEAAAAGGFSLDDLYLDFFDGLEGFKEQQRVRLGLPESPTLMQVLQYPQVYGGAAFNNVGDLLSEAHPDVAFDGERVEGSCPLSADASRRE